MVARDAEAQIFDGLYQIAYVVADIDCTVAQLQAFGVGEFKVERDIVRPGGSGTIRHSAKAWMGPVMLELIEPWRDRKSIYDAPIPQGQFAFLHHLGFDVEDDQAWPAVTGAIHARALPVVSAGTVPGILNYAYADTLDDLGLMLEHVELMDRCFYDGVPRNAGERQARGLLDGFFQLGFVTRSLHDAKTALAKAIGIDSFTDVEAPPDGPVRRRAWTWVGGQMLELIEPDPAVPSSFRDLLPATGSGARLHHLGMRLQDEDDRCAVLKTLARLGVASTSLDAAAELPVLLADCRAHLGHLIAYVELGPDAPALFQGGC